VTDVLGTVIQPKHFWFSKINANDAQLLNRGNGGATIPILDASSKDISEDNHEAATKSAVEIVVV
jgi:hypothetical protein